MDKEDGDGKPDRDKGGAKDKSVPTPNMLDAASLFAYWPRSDPTSGHGTSSHSIFGSVPSGYGNHLAHLPGTYAMMGRPPTYGVPPPTTAAGSYGSLGTLSVAASQAASLGINPASAAWWTMASHLAAQDYLARLQATGGIPFPGLTADALVPGFELLAPPQSQHGSSKVASSKSSTSKSSSSSSSATTTTTTSTFTTSSKSATLCTSSVPTMTSTSTAGGSVISDPSSILGGVRLPPDTEIIKYTSSIIGPKIPGTTNRGRKKTISLDPPSVTVVPSLGLSGSSGFAVERKRRPLESRERSSSSPMDRVEVIKLPAHTSTTVTNGTVGSTNSLASLNIPTFSPFSSASSSAAAAADDAPLNLSLKPQTMSSSSTTTTASTTATPTSTERTSRRKPGPKPRRIIQTSTPTSNSALSISSIMSPTVGSPSPLGSPSVGSSSHASSPLTASSLATSLATPSLAASSLSVSSLTTPSLVSSSLPSSSIPGSSSLAHLFASPDTSKQGSDDGDSQSKDLQQKLLNKVEEPAKAQEQEPEVVLNPVLPKVHRDGRPRNLGRGISKPKKNTVASLLAQSRALGLKPTVSTLNHQVSLLKSNVLMQQSEKRSGERSSPGSEGSYSNDIKTDDNNLKPKKHLVSSTTEDGKLKIRAVEGSSLHFSDDSSIPDISSDSNSEGLSDSEMSSEEPFNEVSSSDKSKKREAEDDGSGQVKRRKIMIDERELRIPLEHGWRRETVIRGLSRTGVIRGEVGYYSPCGRRFKQYPDVVRYLEKHNISDISRENFSFSSKAMIGDFLQPTSGAAGEDYIRLTEEEVVKRIDELRLSKGWKPRSSKQSRLSEEELLRRQLEAQELARIAHEHKIQQQIEREKALLAAKEAKRLAKEEAQRQKEQMRMMKEQEKLERQEAMRRERELRAQQMMEERELKRQQAVMLKEQERERRRQHMLLVKALEARKRQEERERKKQEVKAEKIATKERKMEKRRLEMELIRELKKPAEDMELTDQQSLPTLNRIPGLKLSGKAFADTLMVFEFLHNFGETLGFDMDSLPSLNSLQMALLNDEEAEEELLSVMTHLLVCAIEDPGIPNPARHTTILGQSLKQADITHTNLSEILRIYLYANATGEIKALTGIFFERERDREKSPLKNNQFHERLKENQTCKMSEWLKEHPFLALNPTQKAAILAFLCNELLQNKAVLRQIENSIENVGIIRKDRWIMEGKIRKLKLIQARKFRQVTALPKQEGCEESNDTSNTGDDQKPVEEKKEKEEEEEEEDDDKEDEDKENESGNESEGTQESELPEEEEDKNLTPEELTKKIERLTRQCDQSLQELSHSAQQLRATCFGQDRYWRRYWAMPCAGGVFVEAMESAEPEIYSDGEEEPEEKKSKLEKEEEEEKMENEDEKPVKVKEEESEVDDSGVVDGDTNADGADDSASEKSASQAVVKQESVEADDTCKPETSETSNSVVKDVNSDAETAVKIEDKEQEVVKEEKVSETKQGEEEESVKCETKESVDSKESTDPSSVENSNVNSPVPVKEENGKCDALVNEDGSKVLRESLNSEPSKEKENDNNNGFMQEPSVADKATDSTDKEAKESRDDARSPVIVPNGDKFNVLNHNMYLNSRWNSPVLFNGSVLGKDLNGSFIKMENSVPGSFNFSPFNMSSCSFSPSSIVYGTSEKQWFSILPKEPCDTHSLTKPTRSYETTSRTEIKIPSFPKPFQIGSPQQECSPSPSSRPSQSESPACLLSPEELLQLEILKKINQEAEAKPVPRELRRGWWRITDPDQLKIIINNLHPRGVRERELKRTITRYMEYAMESCGKFFMQGDKAATDLAITDMDHKISALLGGAPLPDELESWSEQIALRVDLLMLEQVEALEDKVANASMQVKGWKVPSRATTDDSLSFRPACIPPSGEDDKRLNPITLAKDRLLCLEAAIERRYLKAPLGTSSSDLNLSGLSGDSGVLEDVPKGLMVWREAVAKAETAAQLAMAFYMLEASIAWDKSIMKAVSPSSVICNCQFCHSGDNEDKLLLCDGCDKGYHTYCFKPKMEQIPDGDWYCYECLNKATGERNCIVCGKKVGKNLVLCDQCPRAYHTDCLQPPINKVPRGKWICPGCQSKQPKKRGRRPKMSESEGGSGTQEEVNPSPPPKKDRKKIAKDLTPCKTILEDLESHDEAWPFLLPVNTKQFPTYRKIIKNPMDLSTIKKKLQDGVYKSREDFCADVRHIFNNCETFNEDDSPVGKAGHSMRSFFETRWSELNSH